MHICKVIHLLSLLKSIKIYERLEKYLNKKSPQNKSLQIPYISHIKCRDITELMKMNNNNNFELKKVAFILPCFSCKVMHFLTENEFIFLRIYFRCHLTLCNTHPYLLKNGLLYCTHFLKLFLLKSNLKFSQISFFFLRMQLVDAFYLLIVSEYIMQF